MYSCVRACVRGCVWVCVCCALFVEEWKAPAHGRRWEKSDLLHAIWQIFRLCPFPVCKIRMLRLRAAKVFSRAHICMKSF